MPRIHAERLWISAALCLVPAEHESRGHANVRELHRALPAQPRPAGFHEIISTRKWPRPRRAVVNWLVRGTEVFGHFLRPRRPRRVAGLPARPGVIHRPRRKPTVIVIGVHVQRLADLP